MIITLKSWFSCHFPPRMSPVSVICVWLIARMTRLILGFIFQAFFSGKSISGRLKYLVKGIKFMPFFLSFFPHAFVPIRARGQETSAIAFRQLDYRSLPPEVRSTCLQTPYGTGYAHEADSSLIVRPLCTSSLAPSSPWWTAGVMPLTITMVKCTRKVFFLKCA